MAFFLGALSVWFVVSVASEYLELPKLAWYLLMVGAAVGWCFLAELPKYDSIAVAGLAQMVRVTETLLLLVSDRAMVDMRLRNQRR